MVHILKRASIQKIDTEFEKFVSSENRGLKGSAVWS